MVSVKRGSSKPSEINPALFNSLFVVRYRPSLEVMIFKDCELEGRAADVLETGCELLDNIQVRVRANRTTPKRRAAKFTPVLETGSVDFTGKIFVELAGDQAIYSIRRNDR